MFKTVIRYTFSRQGKYGAAEKLQREALATYTRLMEKDHHETLTVMHNLASSLRKQGQLAEAAKIQGEVLTTRRRVFGPEHPATLLTSVSLCVYVCYTISSLRTVRTIENTRDVAHHLKLLLTHQGGPSCTIAFSIAQDKCRNTCTSCTSCISCTSSCTNNSKPVLGMGWRVLTPGLGSTRESCSRQQQRWDLFAHSVAACWGPRTQTRSTHWPI
jgi:hypothetical protein